MKYLLRDVEVNPRTDAETNLQSDVGAENGIGARFPRKIVL